MDVDGRVGGGQAGVGGFVASLRRRPDELAVALAGTPLLLRVVVVGEDTVVHEIALTRDGNVASPAGPAFAADVEVRGSEAEVEAVLGGRVSVDDAAATHVVRVVGADRRRELAAAVRARSRKVV